MNKKITIEIISELKKGKLNSKTTSEVVKNVVANTKSTRDEVVTVLLSMIELKMIVSLTKGTICDFENAGIWFDDFYEYQKYSINKTNVIRLRTIFADLLEFEEGLSNDISTVEMINKYIDQTCKEVY